mgnify:FL=1
MNLRYRLLGGFIVVCGLAVCYGAVVLWPAGLLASPLTWSEALRIAGALVAAVLGVGNVFAGLVVVMRPPVLQ